ncbi:cell cycle checkpoint control protein RAD9B isoform X2 [Falco biarmicus]|uniref:cell cycle checkpoint control protein RAD9B isoform X2 n=1 Tax=Falco cherrug TaxID=345164 RepID=UPI0024796947|nr:cell cycle checkpoint control protein RAD9B isoform X2 [Falco cherrug]XP_056182233.1 cell cycle checkpoint control protein RAD9B isoform X2 [Falco biarmicus]
MKCVIGGAHLRVFGRAIHAIARISDEFWFDPVEKGLALRSVNSSRSAYAYVFFSSMFFQHYCWTAVSQPCQKKKQLFHPYKLIIKSVLPIFRCVNVLERNVEKCSIYTNIYDHHITFQLLCKHGVVKTYNLMFQECDPLQAVFAKHMCPNILKVHSRLLADIMIHFPTSQEEVTLSVTPMKVCFKSYTEEDTGNEIQTMRPYWDLKTDFSKTMLTEIQLNPDEFDYFQVGVDSEVTFCLKELRGLLAFSETTSVPVSIHFDVSGKPVAFSVEDTVLEASFILATLSEAEKETAFQQPPGFSQQWESSKTHTGKCEETSMGKGSNAAAAASKKPQWNGNTPNTGSAKPPSPLAKREIKNTARATRTAMTKAEDHAALEGEATVSHYQKFHTLFFGAVSCRKDAISHTFHSLATASDTEEDFGNMECSPVL